MVENVVEDTVEPNPGKNKGSGEASGVGISSGGVESEHSFSSSHSLQPSKTGTYR